MGTKVEIFFLAWSLTPKPDAAVRVEHRLPTNAERPSVNFLGPVTFLSLEGTVLGVSGGLRFGSSRGSTRLVTGGDPLSTVLGTRIGPHRSQTARAARRWLRRGQC